jgi:hypothetical protein
LALTFRFGRALAFALGLFRALALAPAFGFAGAAAGLAGMGGTIGDAGGAGVGVQGSGSPNMRSIVSSVGTVGSRLNYPAVEISPAQERN